MSTTTTLETRTFYYQVLPNLNIVYVDRQLYAPLYSDQECTKVAGYYYLTTNKNIIDNNNNIKI